MGIKTIISTPTNVEQVKTAINAVEFITSIHAQNKKATVEQYGILYDEVSEVLNNGVIIGGAVSGLYDYTEAISHQEGVCGPEYLTTALVQAKSLLADLLASIDPAHLKADAPEIVHKFSEVNACLSLAAGFFNRVTVNGKE